VVRSYWFYLIDQLVHWIIDPLSQWTSCNESMSQWANESMSQSNSQAPGPRGSPQEPQAPPLPADSLALLPLAATANTESCCSSLALWQCGHCAFFAP